MRRLVIAPLIALLAAAPAGAVILSPTPYLSAADSPFAGLGLSNFALEDFEDIALNTPGLSAAGPGLCVSGAGGQCFQTGPIDSVGNGGDPALGHSLFANGSITLTFDAAAFGGRLPTHAGLVWTDGNNPITFTAFDQNGVSLGTIVGNHATGGFTGQTDEDRFYGAIHAGGISRLVISNPPGIEIDHIQFGFANAVPEPASWAMMIAGFGLAGAATRRRRRMVPAIA
ncbi:PEPxxWA-CTERM sorting domain-containing protein [Sphingomonas sp.]|jgi:hypothetical protein|uniref:PEPxxWA-CTERM sorting domain-containing protein n=1 Tax=Sphingomonas sp. TaxID=28214 RepID=UPI002DE7B50E|nr:PEPxxWA-CTERM sorting domain-containing protein [Sphingomonas sp.]